MTRKGIAQEFRQANDRTRTLCSSREKVLAIMWEALILFRKNQKVSICLLVVSAAGVASILDGVSHEIVSHLDNGLHG